MSVLIVITYYKRYDSCMRLVEKLREENNADIVIFDDCSKDDIKNAENFGRTKVISNSEHYGKREFWMTFNNIFQYCKHYVYDYYIILPDDVYPCDNFVEKAVEAFDSTPCVSMCPLLTNRSIYSGVSRWGMRKIITRETCYVTHYFDCCGIVKRYFFEALDWRLTPIVPSTNKYQSSGVGRQITMRLQEKRGVMCHVKRTLLKSTEDDSQMNKEERARHPMRADFDDNEKCVDVYMASLWRDGHVLKTAESLLSQPELNTLFITCNNYTQEQYEMVCTALDKMKGDKNVVTRRAYNEKHSNEKMFGLNRGTSKYIAFADDDLVYMQDYLFYMIHGCQLHDAAVSLHGALITDFPLRRYYGEERKTISWNRPSYEDEEVDILGNGFMLLRRDMLTPEELDELYDSAPTVSMDDIVMSHMLKKKGIPMFVLAHERTCATHKPLRATDDYVYERYKDNDKFQVDWMNKHFTREMFVGIRAVRC